MSIQRFIIIVLLVLLLPVQPAVAEYSRRTPVVEAVEKAAPAVVNIRTEQIVKRRSSPFFGFADPFFDQFFQGMGPQRTYTTQSLGSGVIIDPRGYVLTNAHVIEKASRIYVALPDRQKEVEAELVGSDARFDLAVVKIKKKGKFPYLAPARSDDLMAGETVIAIGNPLGLGSSVTTGVVSAPQRRMATGDGGSSIFIQTDALINPGNSGGPLLNINGELIGINTAIIQQAQGIGFAIPISMAKRVISDLMKFGRIRPVFTGILPAAVSPSFVKARGAGGVLVRNVDPDSPAQQAGIRVADVILSIDGTSVASPAEFYSLLVTYTPGDVVHLNLLRGTDTLEKTLRLAALPENFALRYSRQVFGLVPGEGRGGVVVKEVEKGSPADRIGIEAGDKIAEVDGVSVDSLTNYRDVLEERIGREPLRFLIVRGNRGYYVDLP